jgi:hypothetical protein
MAEAQRGRHLQRHRAVPHPDRRARPLPRPVTEPHLQPLRRHRHRGLRLQLPGPQNFSDRYVYNVTLTLEHRFDDTFSLRSGANWFERGLTRQEVGGRDQFNPLTRTVQRGTPRLRPFPEGGAELADRPARLLVDPGQSSTRRSSRSISSARPRSPSAPT